MADTSRLKIAVATFLAIGTFESAQSQSLPVWRWHESNVLTTVGSRLEVSLFLRIASGSTYWGITNMTLVGDPVPTIQSWVLDAQLEYGTVSTWPGSINHWMGPSASLALTWIWDAPPEVTVRQLTVEGCATRSPASWLPSCVNSDFHFGIQTLVLVAPRLDTVSPSSVTAGSSATTLTLEGEGFTSACRVSWGEQIVPTNYLDSTRLEAIVDAPLLVDPGSVAVSVVVPEHDVWGYVGLLPPIWTLIGRAPQFGSASKTVAIDIVDRNGNGTHDATDIANGTSSDANSDGVPDDVQVFLAGPGLQVTNYLAEPRTNSFTIDSHTGVGFLTTRYPVNQVYRVQPDALTIEPLGPRLETPGRPVIDRLGRHGPPGSVLVPHIGPGSTGMITAIAADGSTSTVLGPSTEWVGIIDFAMDADGRLLMARQNTDELLVSTGDAPTVLLTGPPGTFIFKFALSPEGDIYVLWSNGEVRAYEPDGTPIGDPNGPPFTTLPLGAAHPIIFGNGPAPWGVDLFAFISSNRVLRIRPDGSQEDIATGAYWMQDNALSVGGFGPDNSLYYSVRNTAHVANERILRIRPVGITGTATPASTEPVVVELQGPGSPTVTFDSVLLDGITTVTEPDPDWLDGPLTFGSGYVGGRVVDLYDIQTSAVFDGPVRVCLHYGTVPTQLEPFIRLFHLVDGAWVDVTDAGYPDLVNHVVCGTVESFSLLGVFAFDAEVAISALIQEVMNLNLQHGITNSLDAKLSAARQALIDLVHGNNGAVVNALRAFCQAVEAQSGNHVPAPAAADLIQRAQTVIGVIESS